MPASAPSPSPDAATPPEKPKWGKGKIAAISGGGCCLLIVLALIVLGLIGTALGGGDEDVQPTAEPTVEAEVEPSEDPTEDQPEPEAAEPDATEEEAANDEAAPAEPATEEEPETPAGEESVDPAVDDAQSWADGVEETALLGTADWQELCGGDYSLGICWISDVTASSVGTLDVHLQVNGKDAETQGYAEGVANSVFSTAGFEHEDLEWVVVYDAGGTVIDQKKRSDYPYLS